MADRGAAQLPCKCFSGNGYGARARARWQRGVTTVRRDKSSREVGEVGRNDRDVSPRKWK